MNPHWWYSEPVVLWNIFRCLKNRYLSIRPEKNITNQSRRIIRYNRVTRPQDIPMFLEHWDCEPGGHKLYMDIVEWKKLDLFNFHSKKRKEQKELFKKEFDYHIDEHCNGSCLIDSLPFVIDIDAKKDKFGQKKKNYELTKERALRVAQWLHKPHFKKKKFTPLTYGVINTSNNGFQFYCPAEQFPPQKSPEEQKNYYAQLAEYCNRTTKTDIDFAMYDLRRIMKLPYSLCEGTVVLPLSFEQLKSWTPEFCNPEKVLHTIPLKNRGWIWNVPDKN